MNSRIAAGTVALLACVMLAGCVPANSVSSPSTTSSPAPSSAPTHSPSAKPQPSALTCGTLVTPAALAEWTSNGNEANPDFEAKVRAEGGDLVHILNLGGVVCQWGYPGSDASLVLAFARVTTAQAQQERGFLSADGWTASTEPSGDQLWSPASLDDYLGNVPAYEFKDGTIRYALDAPSSFKYFAV